MLTSAKKLSCTCLSIALFNVAYAQTSSLKMTDEPSALRTSEETSTLKLDEVTNGALANPESDIDNKITDARMRAELGSKSKWSFKSRVNYTGGSVEGPFDKVSPNLRRRNQMDTISSLSGDVGINYRLTPSDSLGVGTGIMIVDPLHGNFSGTVADKRNSRDVSESRYQISSPFMEWKKGYVASDTMVITNIKYSQSTDSDDVNLMKCFGKAFVFNQANKNIGTSPWSIGAMTMMMKSFYSGEIADPKLIKAQQRGILRRGDYSLGIAPFLQYNMSDRYSLRTEFNYFSFVKFENSNELYQEEPFQSLGLGISITRDIYLFPNVQLAAKDIRADRTNVALSATVNLF